MTPQERARAIRDGAVKNAQTPAGATPSAGSAVETLRAARAISAPIAPPPRPVGPAPETGGLEPPDHLRPMQYGTGQYAEERPDAVTAELARKYKGMMGAREGGYGTLPPERQEQINEQARARAREEVAARVGTSERRGNMIVSLDEQNLLDDIKVGNDWLGWATGQYATRVLTDRVTGGAPVRDWIDEKLAPFHAMALPGWTSADIAKGEKIAKPQREGKGWWLLRASPLQPVMSYVMSDDENMTWGSDEHLRAIQSYDYTQDWYRMGEALYGWTPEVIAAALNPPTAILKATGAISEDTAEKVLTTQLGMAATGAMIWLDPDALSLSTVGLGKAAGGVFKTGRLIDAAVVKPVKAALGEMKEFRALGDSVAAVGSKVLAKYGPNSAQMRAYTAAVNNTIGHLINQGLSATDAGKLGVADMTHLSKELDKVASESLDAGKAVDTANQALGGARAAYDSARAGVKAAEAAGQAEVEGVKAAAKQAAAGEAEKFFGNFVVGHEAATRAQQSLEEVLAARGMGVHANAEDFMALLEQAKGIRTKMSTIVKRIDKLMKERREMTPPFNVSRFDEIEKEVRALAKMKLALEAKALANGTDMAVAALLKRLRSAQSGMEAMKRVAAKKYGLDAARLEAAAEQAIRSGAKKHKVVDDIASAAEAAAKPKVEAAVAGAQARAAKERAKALAGVEGAARAGIAAVDETIAAEAAAMKALEKHRLVSSAESLFDKELQRIIGEAQNFQKLVNLGDAAPRAFKYADSALKAATANGGGIDLGILGAEAAAKYGQDVADELVKIAQSLPSKPSWRDIQGLRRVEEAAHIDAEQARLGAHATIHGIADLVAKGPKPSNATMAQRVLRAVSTAGRAFDSMRRWGADMVPETLRKITAKAVHRGAGLESEIDDVASKWGMDGVWRHMQDEAPLSIKDRSTVFGGFGHKGLDYLKMVAAAGKEAWDDDQVVRALANAWQPSGRAGELEAGQVREALFRYVTSPDAGLEGLRDWFMTKARGIWLKSYDKADKAEVAQRFFVRGLAQAANMHDAVMDYHRATVGLGLNAQLAKAMNFLADPNNTTATGLLLEARRAAQSLGIPLAKNIRNIFEGQSKQGEILRMVAKVPDSEVWMSERYWKGLQSIPSRLAKELDQFHEAGSLTEGAKRGLSQYLQAWRMSVLFGAILPRPGMFATSMVGDWSQMCVTLGFRPATRITAANVVTNIPFIGRKIQDQMSDSARYNSVVRAIFDPNLAQVMRGSDDVIIETADGPMSAAQFMREAIEDGAHDAIGSGDLAEITARVKDSSFIKKLARFALGGEVQLNPVIKATTRMFESVQFRTRMSLYLEARTGRMTGKAMSRAESAEALSKALYDYRTGPTDIELNSIARVSAFWVYRRNMLRQLGSALVEPFTNPDVVTAGRAFTGNTAIGRARKGAYALQWAPDVLDWSDEGDAYTLDDKTTDALGMQTAPWWVTNKHWLANIPLPAWRREWNKERLGRDAPYESVVLNGLVFADMIWTMNLWSQTAAAVAAQAGLVPGATSAPWKDIAETNIDQFTDGLLPGLDRAVEGLMKRPLGIEMRESPESAPADQTMALRRFADILHAGGMDSMVFTDEKGRTKIDDGFMGLVFGIVASHPMLADSLRHMKNIDNASMSQSAILGVLEAMVRESGFVSIAPTNPWASRNYEVDAQQRALKDLKAEANKRR